MSGAGRTVPGVTPPFAGGPAQGPARGWHASGFAAPDRALILRSLPQALAEAAALWPNSSAVIDRGRPVSFAELIGRVGGLAAQIAAVQAVPGPVAILQSVGVDAVAAWFACALAGRPLLMLEPGNPPERTRSLIGRAGAAILLHDRELDPDLTAGLARDLPGLTLLRPDGRCAPMVPAAGLGPTAPALIFPTSGSTGEPKMITYSAATLLAKVQSSIPLMGAMPGDRVLIAGSHSNYGFMHHALVFVLTGGALCLADVRTEGLAAVFAAILTQGVRHVRFTPSLFRVAANHSAGREALGALRGLRFSGEPLLSADLELAHAVLHPDCRIQNVYGSTESALFIWTDDRRVPPVPGTVPIGRIYPMSEFALLDEEGMPVADGELGELVIRSAHHALGDWQGGRVNETRFPPDPRGGGLRLYQTGDIARLGPQGSLSVAGRKDRLVKINGQRVSLDEIEADLQAMPGCAQAVVLERPGLTGNRLVAFLLAQEAAPPADPAAWLAQRLPGHMVPAGFHWVAQMPLLAGGKVDRKALLASLPGQEAPVTPAPADDPMAVLKAIWQRILKLPDFAADADFFSLGGDSLLLMEMQLAVKQRFGTSFPGEVFAANPTLNGLATLIGMAPVTAPGTAPARKALAPGEVEVSFRLVRKAIGPSQGTAICMAGGGGAAPAERLAESNLFPGFDFWACDARFDSGKIKEHEHWRAIAVAAAAMIANGQAPRPTVLAGYSIGGFIAWLTARLLGTSAFRPERVVMIDAPSLHRRAGYRSAALDALLAPSAGTQIEILNLHCAYPEPWRFSAGEEPGWQPQDGRIASLGVLTVEHLDMVKPAVLDRVAEVVNLFAEQGLAAPMPARPLGGIDTFSGKVTELLQMSNRPDRTALHALLANPSAFMGTNALSGLQFLALAHADKPLALAFCAQLKRLHPTLRSVNYAQIRLGRLPDAGSPQPARALLGPSDAPVFAYSLAAVDMALRLRCGSVPGYSALCWMRARALLPAALRRFGLGRQGRPRSKAIETAGMQPQDAKEHLDDADPGPK